MNAPESDRNFVEECYQLFLNRRPDDLGLAHYLAVLSTGRSRTSVALEFARSDEFIQAQGRAQTGDWSHWDLPSINRHGLEIDLREPEQLTLLQSLAPLFEGASLPETPTSASRYYLNNPWFNYLDGILLHLVLRYFHPKRVVEIGSGFSSALVVDTNESHLGNRLTLTCIDPDPSRLQTLVGETANLRLIAQRVQDVPPETFEQLESGDILFIDSSHSLQPGSDVAHLLFSVLPALPAGVLIHFHDIFSSFSYPPEWFERRWNEGPALRLYLTGNSLYEILLFSDLLATAHRERLAQLIPLALKQPDGSPFPNSGVSLWLRKARAGAVYPPDVSQHA
jgi:predicted O-methyltransferase YrrM